MATTGGLKFPTAPWHADAAGRRLPLEAQSGTGSLDALLGLSLSVFRSKWSGYASTQWAQPVAARDALQPGRSLRASLALQHQSWPWLALRAGADGRWSAQSREGNEPDPNSGGWLLLAGGDMLFSAFAGASVSAGLRAPVLNRLRGSHDEGPQLALGWIQDW
jgi:hypothetical protein